MLLSLGPGMSQGLDTTPPAHAGERQLDRVREYAVEIGDDVRLVQGAGGNFSVKVDDVLWIKASGTRLASALDEQIFLPMRLRDTRDAVLQTQDLAPLVRSDHATAGLRPSIETSLHALLPHRVVLHVHSTAAIAAGLGGGIAGALPALPDWFGTAVVPYAKPGIELAGAVFAVVGEDVPETPLALLLLNHGLIAAADDVASAQRIIAAVQTAFAHRPAPDFLDERAAARRADGWTLLHPAGTVSLDEFAVLLAGPLTPDQAVFMGPVPFTSLIEPDPASLAAVDADGAIWVRSGSGADEIEIIRSIVDVARLVRGASPTPLTTEQVDELINWEAEKWRRGLRR